MAGVPFVVTSGQISSTAVAKTILQVIAATNQRVILDEVRVSFEGVTANNPPIQVDILRQTSAGTGGSAATVAKLDPSMDETIQTTALSGMTGEPTASDIYSSDLVHPQTGISIPGPFIIPGGGRIGVRVTASTSVDTIVTVRGQE